MNIDDTFDKLRRVDYEVACTEYVLSCMYLRSDAPREEIKAVCDPVLIPLGWTFDTMLAESDRLRRLEGKKEWL